MLGIVIPVYNEGTNIKLVLRSLIDQVKTPFRVFICYDFDEDNTLPALSQFSQEEIQIELVKNSGRGPHQAVLCGFQASLSLPEIEGVVVFPADDTFNAPLLDKMYSKMKAGSEIVCASRFMSGGTMEGCPWLKSTMVRLAAFSLYHLAKVPTHDPTSGFRLFSRKVLESFPVESSEGFTYSLELLVKSHRHGFKITEVPALWREREHGGSRFQVIKWLPAYFRWYAYAFETTYVPGKKEKLS